MATGAVQERKLAVIMHADVVGSTALMQRAETLAHQRTETFPILLSKMSLRHSGCRHIVGAWYHT